MAGVSRPFAAGDRDPFRDVSRRRTGDPASSEPSFERALQRLEEVVDQLESGDLELEQALAAFEQGVALARRCAERLEDAEQRIEVLVREGRKWSARPFEGDASDADYAPGDAAPDRLDESD